MTSVTLPRPPTGVLIAMLLLASIVPQVRGMDEPSRHGPPADDATIDAYLRQAVADLGIPGLAFSIVRDGAAPHILVVGTADDRGRAITRDTPFLLASVSKAFTATAIMQLVEAGRIDLDTPVRTYLPWFRVADENASGRITVRELLEQSSGLTTAEGHAPVPADDQADDALERSVRSFATDPLAFPPGEGYQYSNANYDTAAEVVQTVAGVLYDQYLEEHIYAPLRMAHSHATAAAARADGLAEGAYQWFGSIWRTTAMPLPRSMPGSATTFSSIGDMTRWVQANLRGGELDGTRILSADGMATLHRGANPIDEYHAYGMGWQVRPLWETLQLLPGEAGTSGAPAAASGGAAAATGTVTLPLLIEHGGSWANGHTYVGLAPSAGWGFALLVDAGDEAASRLDVLEANILRLLGGEAPTPPADPSDPLVSGRYVLVIGLFALELVSLAWAIRAIHRRRRGPAVEEMLGGHRQRSSRRTLASFGLAIALDVLVVWLYAAFIPGHFDNDLMFVLRGAPDAALFIVPTMLLAIGWGPIRTVWLGWLLIRRPRPFAAQPA